MQAPWLRGQVDTDGLCALLLSYPYPGLPREVQSWERGTRQTLGCRWTWDLMAHFQSLFFH